jgi:hypothetical protein
MSKTITVELSLDDLLAIDEGLSASCHNVNNMGDDDADLDHRIQTIIKGAYNILEGHEELRVCGATMEVKNEG